jgi:predicted secreted protein
MIANMSLAAVRGLLRVLRRRKVETVHQLWMRRIQKLIAADQARKVQ